MNRPSRNSNHTGTAMAADQVKEMVQGTKEFGPSSSGDHRAIAQVRIQYASQGAPVGSFPPPKDNGQFQHAAQRAPSEQVMDLFMDKLGARLAFERAGVRLYEALLSKHEAYGGFTGGPSAQDIQHICDEEFQHFKMLRECTEQLGGDPTAVTPAADVEATAGMGIGQVLTDPRTDLVQCLDAILVAELADNANWEMLCEIADQSGNPGMKEMFTQAFREEQEHVTKVKGWLTAAAAQAQQRMAA